MSDSAQKFCFISAGFRAEILFDICGIPCINSLRCLLDFVSYQLDCVQKFYSMAAAFQTEILLPICWVPYRTCVPENQQRVSR